ncbi:MAG: DUF2325 domain-containing protein [Candidatus Omnitrophota bacterium]
METTELRLILQNCFTPQKLQRILHDVSKGRKLIDSAVEAILNDSEAGAEIAGILDRESENQREKIRSMSARELRSGFSVDFLEPGRKLGLILWALLRDDRLSARTLAREIAVQFTESQIKEEEEAVIDFNMGSFSPEAREILDEISEEIEEDREEAEEPEELRFEEQEENAYEPDLSDEDLDMERILAELEQEERKTAPDEEDSSVEIEFPEEEALENIEILDVEPDIEEEPDIAGLIDESLLDEDEESIDLDLSDRLVEEEEDISPISIDEEMSRGMEEVDKLIAALEEEDKSSVRKGVTTVPIGGVEISLDSLQRACERVFNEPVELVTDENLTRQDKIVVIGKRCGLYVLQGPRYKIEPAQTSYEQSGEPIDISPVSLRAALSKIHDEEVELVPDPDLLSAGIIVFTGKQTGLSVVSNAITKTSLPPWVGPDLEAEIVSPRQAGPSAIDGMNRKIVELEKRIESLVHRPPLPAAPIVIPTPPPLPKAKEPEPEKEMEGDIAEEALSLDDIETEELEPLPEEIPQAVLDESLEEEEESGVSALDELLSEDIGGDLDALLEEETETAEEEADDEMAESLEEEVSEDLELPGNDLNLDELDLDALVEMGEEEEEADTAAESEEEEEIAGGEDELDLDALDLGEDSLEMGELDEDALDEALLGEEISEESLGDDLGLDLDVLQELDKEEKKSGSKKIFNGDRILLLGGEKKHEKEYQKIVKELGGTCEWHLEMDNKSKDEINEAVDRADLIVTLASIADPGILQAASYAKETNKRLFKHHSANPSSVKKKLTQLVEEGKV